MNCILCEFNKEYYRYKTRREDGNDCIVMYCEHPKAEGNKYESKRICTYREYGSLRTGKDNRIRTSPRWRPLKESESR